jgi:hypothetical protein
VVRWVHPLAAALVRYRAYGKRHTLSGFWMLCERCEAVCASGDDEAAVVIMQASGFAPGCATAQDVAELIRKPLEVFRRADTGGRRLPD